MVRIYQDEWYISQRIIGTHQISSPTYYKLQNLNTYFIPEQSRKNARLLFFCIKPNYSTSNNNDQKKDFNALFIEWFKCLLDEACTSTEVEEILDWIDHNHFFMDDAQKDAVRIFYDRLNGLPKQTKRTSDFFGIDSKTVYNYTKKMRAKWRLWKISRVSILKSSTFAPDFPERLPDGTGRAASA